MVVTHFLESQDALYALVLISITKSCNHKRRVTEQAKTKYSIDKSLYSIVVYVASCHAYIDGPLIFTLGRSARYAEVTVEVAGRSAIGMLR